MIFPSESGESAMNSTRRAPTLSFLDPNIAKTFKDSESVNRALRLLDSPRATAA
jgi:hypothetical protein